jgi:hypothetical protein
MNKFIIANTSTSFPSTPVLNEGIHWHGNSFNTSQSLKSQSIHDISDSTSLSFTYNVLGYQLKRSSFFIIFTEKEMSHIKITILLIYSGYHPLNSFSFCNKHSKKTFLLYYINERYFFSSSFIVGRTYTSYLWKKKKKS